MGQSGTASRAAAAELLLLVLEERRTLDEALNSVDAYETLQGPDRGFARAMASAALRQLGRINLALQPVLDRPLEAASPAARAFLLIGAAQIWCLDTPAHAAVGETVEAAKSIPDTRRAAGFLNAVLRKLPQQKSDFDALPAEDIWPDWFRNVLHGQFDEANSAALAQQQLAVPDLHLTAKDGDGAGLAERIGGTWLSGPTAACAAAIVTDLPGFDTGDWWVQDAAAALPAQLLAVQPGDSVVDLCAAPGGKTLQLASLGANVFAIDRSKTRLQRVEENLARTNLLANVTLVASKGEAWTPPGPVDAVLVDAPCSALGTLRRHPEGPWIKRPDEIAGYPNAQKRLLAAAVDMLKPDGRLVYCVCSPLQQEGAEVVEAIIAEHPVSRSPIQPQDVPGFEHTLTADGDLVTLPGGKFAHDAFFISRLVKHA